MQRTNDLGQPIGAALPNWKPPERPSREPMEGRFCLLEALDPERHGESLSSAFALDSEGKTWTYLPYGPFESPRAYRAWLESFCGGEDPLFYAVVDKAVGRATGVASYLRINPPAGTIEVGHIAYSPQLQRTAAASEAMYLMMERAFGLGYRRYEWKCDSLNEPSRRAAKRLGFVFEGVFRQANIYKGRNRDTAWYAIVDTDWAEQREAFRRWLDPGNFDANGNQRTRLCDLRTGGV
jgi:RimJ/RimL family protein N-acetyltransferase